VLAAAEQQGDKKGVESFHDSAPAVIRTLNVTDQGAACSGGRSEAQSAPMRSAAALRMGTPSFVVEQVSIRQAFVGLKPPQVDTTHRHRDYFNVRRGGLRQRQGKVGVADLVQGSAQVQPG
jgi:hypothetical protein